MLTFFTMRRLLIPLTVLACLVGTVPRLLAEDQIKVTILTILATSRNAEVDERLKAIAEEVRKKKPRLTGFTLGPIISKSVPPREKAIIQVTDGQEVMFMVERGADSENRVQLMVKAPSQGIIVYQTVCGKFLPIVTRYRTTKNGDRLILAIMVQPCPQKVNK